MIDFSATYESFKRRYHFHRWKRTLTYVDITLAIIVLLFMPFIRPDYLMAGVIVFLIFYLHSTHRIVLMYHLLVSFFVSLVWMIISRNYYSYNTEFTVIFGINLFPLFSWTVGIFFLYLVYSHYEHLLHEHTFFRRMNLFAVVYWPLLIFVETIGFHVFNIRNNEFSYAGLPLCNCLHAVWWMQIAYFVIGLVFFWICYALKLENPHSKLK